VYRGKSDSSLHVLASDTKQTQWSFYPSPCPSPTRGEGTLWHCSARPETSIRVEMCAHALAREAREHINKRRSRERHGVSYAAAVACYLK